MTNEEKIVLADKVIAKAEAQKAYDKWYNAKVKFYQAELERVVKENKLEGKIKQFDKTKEDFQA